MDGEDEFVCLMCDVKKNWHSEEIPRICLPCFDTLDENQREDLGDLAIQYAMRYKQRHATWSDEDVTSYIKDANLILGYSRQ